MTALLLLRRFWWAPAIIALALWAGRLDRLRGGYKAELAAERAARALDAANAQVVQTKAELRWAKAGTTAATAFADRLATREPIILRSTDTVRTYAQTDAGRAVCLGADRVRGIDALDRDLADAAVASRRDAGGVPTDAGAAPDGR